MAVAKAIPDNESNNIDEEAIEIILDQCEKKTPQSVTIVTFGKTGSGKSTLAKNIAGQSGEKTFNVKEGWEADTMESVFNEAPIQVGEVAVLVVDTRGMMDPNPGTHDDDTIKYVSEIITNDRNGVLLVCIDMFERFDRSALQMLARLHEEFGFDLWKHVIIALTKADRCRYEDWLKSKSFLESKEMFLRKKFAAEIENRKKKLQEFFTITEKEASPGCYFGMSIEYFESLQLPVIPTSLLCEQELERMKRLGCGYWFDQLIVKCCEREQGCGILQIHQKRLSNIPAELVNPEQREQAEKFSTRLRKTKHRAMTSIALALGIKMIWRSYCKEIITTPRFEPAVVKLKQ